MNLNVFAGRGNRRRTPEAWKAMEAHAAKLPAVEAERDALKAQVQGLVAAGRRHQAEKTALREHIGHVEGALRRANSATAAVQRENDALKARMLAQLVSQRLMAAELRAVNDRPTEELDPAALRQALGEDDTVELERPDFPDVILAVPAGALVGAGSGSGR